MRVREPFGPTLATLLRRRFGPRAPRIALVAALVLLGALGAAIASGTADDRRLLEHRDPDFTLLFDGQAVKEVPASDGEILRLEARRGRVVAAVVVRPLPPEASNPALLPLVAARFVRNRGRRDERFVVEDEGKARVNTAPGYQVGYAAGPPGDRGREVYLHPEPDSTEGGLTLSYRVTTGAGRLRPGERAAVLAARRAFRSFRFGLDRP